ncbi:MAG TPA: hypothetical protein VEG38_07070 [Acidimicrobiia bacterium]|nr:hypothetical protein [Acidimicrobiia bacterium]
MLLAAVVLPRRRADEVRTLLPRDSTIAFTALSAMAVAGSVMVLRVAPDPNPDGSVPPPPPESPRHRRLR